MISYSFLTSMVELSELQDMNNERHSLTNRSPSSPSQGFCPIRFTSSLHSRGNRDILREYPGLSDVYNDNMTSLWQHDVIMTTWSHHDNIMSLWQHYVAMTKWSQHNKMLYNLDNITLTWFHHDITTWQYHNIMTSPCQHDIFMTTWCHNDQMTSPWYYDVTMAQRQVFITVSAISRNLPLTAKNREICCFLR